VSTDQTAEAQQEALRQALRSVVDPEIGLDIVDVGLIYDIEVFQQRVVVTMTLTTPACPSGPYLVDQAREAVRAMLPADVEVEVDVVWDPPWTPDRMSETARQLFGW